MKRVIFFLSLFALINLNAGGILKLESGNIEMPSIFSDNMVLQRNTDVSFWGKAEPNMKISINTTWGESSNTIVNSDGKWLTKIKTPQAGGPYEVNLQIGDSVITYKNVLIGEVWLCSGQSNMEMPVQGWLPANPILNSKEEIEKANYPSIRLFTVARAISNKEEFNCKGQWEECNPKTVATFSATAYFFGKNLYDELNIPVGLIHSSWGGTPVEAWTGAKFLGREKDFQKVLEDIKNSGPDIENYNEWLLTHPVVDVSKKEADNKWMNLDFNDSECSEINYTDSNWNVMNLPQYWESTEVGNFDGAVWFRKEIKIPPNWIGRDLVLELGPIDDMDRTYVNGFLIGSREKEGYYNVDRVYNIPGSDVLPNKLVIAVRVVDNQGGGGLWGTKEKLKIYPPGSNEQISLASEWKYLPVAEYRDQKFFVFGAKGNNFNERPTVKLALTPYTPTLLFNGMINPLIPYSIKGVIWYQGEANTGNPEAYTTLFPLMIENWREEWNEQFPFYYVQIAPFDYGDQTHSERLREAQLKTLLVPSTGMAVTLDIGDPNSIHPGDKEDVGDRLARWALAKNYNIDIPYSGPIYKSMKVDGDKIILSFDYAQDGLIIKERNGENNFLIAGKDKVFKKATVKIDNDKLIISNKEIKNPLAVRYCFTNTSEATLFDNDGLPASSFRTDDWNE